MRYALGGHLILLRDFVMGNSIDLISCQIDKWMEEIEDYQRLTVHLRQKIRELRWQAIESDDDEISHYDDVA